MIIKHDKKHRRCRRYFPDALKGRKGEKEIGILNSVWAQSPEERECRRESENSGPDIVKRFSSLDESKYNTQKTICQVFCQKFFLVFVFMIIFIGKSTMDSGLNLFGISIIIRMLNWKTNRP
jgi:hypothetical protein